MQICEFRIVHRCKSFYFMQSAHLASLLIISLKRNWCVSVHKINRFVQFHSRLKLKQLLLWKFSLFKLTTLRLFVSNGNQFEIRQFAYMLTVIHCLCLKSTFQTMNLFVYFYNVYFPLHEVIR